MKEAKRNSLVHKLTAKERARKSSDDMYEDGGILFGKYCEHSVDYVYVDTINDHLKSEKYCSRKETKVDKAEKCMGGSAAGSSQKITLPTLVKCKDARQEFILDYVKLCTLADIPLEKIGPSLRKYCARAGAWPQIDLLLSTYLCPQRYSKRPTYEH